MPKSNGEGSAAAVKSAARILTILGYLAEHRGATFTQIVRDLKLPNSSVHQLLHTGVSMGFIESDPDTKTFRVGLRVWEVGKAYKGAEDLAALAKPFMDELVDRTKETVQLARLSGIDNVYLAISESPHVMKLVSSVGSRLPAHATGLGKVLLSGLSNEELARRLDGVQLARFTDRTITSVSQLRKVLEQVRRDGFAEDDEEYVIGCRCIAMPIRNSAGTVIAAMSVSVPTPRYNDEVASSIRVALAETTRRLELELLRVGFDGR